MVETISSLEACNCSATSIDSKLPWLWGKEAKQTYLIEHLGEIFEEVRRRYQLAEGDFPKLEEYRAALQLSDFSTFPSTDRKILHQLQDILIEDIPKLTSLVARIEDTGPGNVTSENNNGDDSGNENEDGSNYALKSPSRVPKMFTYDEKKHDQEFQNLLIWLGVSLVMVLVIGVSVVSSWNESDRQAYQLAVKQLFARFIPNALLEK